MCQESFRKDNFWDVVSKHPEEYRATFDDADFAKVFYEWGFGFGIPHSYRGKSSGHEILAAKKRIEGATL
jgi:hypothetical protein